MSNKKGLLALSPLFLLIVLIVAFTVYSVDSSHQDTSLSLTVAFIDFEHLCRGYFRRNACQETSGHIQQGCRRQQPDAHALDLRAGWLVCRISQGDGSR